jgi:predicted RNase H-like nuclease (RuvC/YqgF family)
MIGKRHTQLIKETEAVLDAEKKKLEEKQNKTQEEMEALVDVEITYKLVDGGKEAWNVVPILLANDRQRYMKPVKKQIQPLKQDKNTFESQAKQLESLKQEKTNLELQIKEKDKELVSLINDKESLQQGSSSVQHQTKDSKMNSLQVENQELKLKIISLQNENQSLKHRVDKYEQQLKSKDNTTQLLESDGEDINYDTPSEDEDNNNDLNYDDTNESNK